MSIRVSVNSTDIRNHSGVSAKSGKPYSLNFQTIWIHLLDRAGNRNPYPEKVEVILDAPDGKPVAYPVGEFELNDASIYIDRSGNLALRPLLTPLKKVA